MKWTPVLNWFHDSEDKYLPFQVQGGEIEGPGQLEPSEKIE